jgi:hypothetical protein
MDAATVQKGKRLQAQCKGLSGHWVEHMALGESYSRFELTDFGKWLEQHADDLIAAAEQEPSYLRRLLSHNEAEKRLSARADAAERELAAVKDQLWAVRDELSTANEVERLLKAERDAALAVIERVRETCERRVAIDGLHDYYKASCRDVLALLPAPPASNKE